MVLIATLSPEQMVTAFIVLGQGHFIIAYLYQKKAGKMPWFFIVFQLLLMMALVAWVAYGATLRVTLLLTGSLFLLHHFNDEIRLSGLSTSAITWIAGIAPGVAYLGLLLNATTQSFNPTLYAAVSSGIGCFTLGYVLYRGSFKEQLFACYAAAIWLAAIAFLLLSPTIVLPYLFGSLILYHYMEWYLYYGVKLWGDMNKFTRYIKEIVVVYVLLVGGYVLLSMVGATFLFEVLFTQMYFYAATIVHIIMSLVLVCIPFSLYRRT